MTWHDLVGGLIDAVAVLRVEGLAGILFERGWWLLLIPVMVAGVAIGFVVDRRRPTLRLARGEALRQGPAGIGTRFRQGSVVLMGLAGIAFVVALAGPYVKGAPDPGNSNGIDMVIALDVSGSMRAADFRPKDRLNVAKEVIGEYVLSRPRDRVGLVVFAGEAFTQTPLTHDRALVREVLDGVRTGVIKDGTAIGDGLALALARLDGSTAKTKTVILLTDGDNNAGSLAPETATTMAKDLNIRVFPVLVGRGGKVPFPDGTDIFGAPRFVTVEMPVNPTLLKRIANETGGQFFQATDRKSLETSFQDILERLDRSLLQGAPPVRRHIPVTVFVFALGQLLGLGALILRHTRGSVVP